MKVEDLIKSGPTDKQTLSNEAKVQKVSDEAMFSGDDSWDKPIDLDVFDKVKQGLDPKMEDILKKEEAEAAKEDKDDKETAKEDSKESEKSSSKKEEGEEDKSLRDKETKPDNKSEIKKSEDKKSEEQQGDSSDSLIHLELGISPGAVGHFKNMNKAAREWITSELKTRYKKIGELQTKVKEAESKVALQSADGNNLPPSWYEHPDAVSLLPEYQNTLGTYRKAQGLIEHYEKQLIAIEEGDPWQNIDVDEKGNWVQNTFDKPTAQHKLFVSRRIAELREAASELKLKATTIHKNYTSNAIKTREQASALENQYFPQYQDAESLKSNSHYQAIQAALGKFGLSNDRMSGVLSKMYVYTMETLAEKEKLEKQLESAGKAVTTNGKVVVKKNGPTGDDINHGDTGKKVYDNPDDEPVSMDDIDALIQNRR